MFIFVGCVLSTPYMVEHPKFFIEAYERLKTELFSQLADVELQIYPSVVKFTKNLLFASAQNTP